MVELNSEQREALQKAEMLVSQANRALRIAAASNDIDIRHVGWLQAKHRTKGLIALAQEYPFITLTQLEHFQTSLHTVARKTDQLRSGTGDTDLGNAP
jgi:hypothetical protein